MLAVNDSARAVRSTPSIFTCLEESGHHYTCGAPGESEARQTVERHLSFIGELPHYVTMSLWSPHSRLHVGDVRYQPGGEYGPRIQLNLQLFYVWSGEAAVWIDGACTTIRENQSLLLMPLHRERFRFARERETHHGWCEVVEPIMEPYVYERIATLQHRVVPTPAIIRRLSREALALRLDPRWSARSEQHHLCNAILYEFFRASGLPDPALSEEAAIHLPASVRRALDLIHHEYADLSGASEIAIRSGLSQQHLSRLFRQHVGATPAAYLWQVRTDRAVDLVRASGLTLAEVSSQTGFSNQFHMSRRIRAAYDASPQELRRGESRSSRL